jgi:GntR family transcriptional regulator, carbon starvation induced regulator
LVRSNDARAALALEDHIGTTLTVVRNALPGTLPF